MEIAQRWYDLVMAGKTAQAEKLYVKNFNVLTPKVMNEIIIRNTKKTKSYFYLVTFTLKPECVAQADYIEEYIEKQFTKRPALHVVTAHIARELTAAGVPHWHVQVETSIPLCKDRFDYYCALYGHVDVSKTRSQNPQNTLEYISKSTNPKHLSPDEEEPIDLTQGSSQNPQQGYTKSMFLDFD